MTTTWGFRLYGQFEPTGNPAEPNTMYLIGCSTEEIARSRARWWSDFRADVQVGLCVHEDGRGWEDVEPISPDVLAEAA